MNGILSGIRVLDFGRYIAGPLCATLLGDLGAEVIRIEKPEGGEDRPLGPLGSEQAGALLMITGRNKQGMTLNLGNKESKEVLVRLIQSADVVVANLPGPILKKVGLDYESLRALKEDIILTTTSAYGEGGSYSHKIGFDGIAQAMSGSMYMSGDPEKPMKTSVAFVDYNTASLSAFATLAAIFERHKTGKGQHVETSLLSTALNISNLFTMEQAQLNLNRVATGNRTQQAGPADCFQTKDSWVLVQIIGPHMFKRWTEIVNRTDLLEDERFRDDDSRGQHGEVLSEIMSQWCSQFTTKEVLATLEENHLPCAEVLSPQQALDNEHTKATEQFVEVDFPGFAKPAKVAKAPFYLSGTPAREMGRPPLLGEHTERIMESLGYSPEEINQFKADKMI